MLHIVKNSGNGNVRDGRRLLSRKPQPKITRAELTMLIDEVGGEEVRQVMRALNLAIEFDTQAE